MNLVSDILREQKEEKKNALIKKLKDLSESNNNETAHVLADEALIEYINDKDIKDAFDSISKWYA